MLGMVICEVFSAISLLVLLRNHWKGTRREAHGRRIGWGEIAPIAVPVGLTSLVGTLLHSANSVLIPAKLVEGGWEAGEAMSAFGVLCGMTIPLLAMPTGFVGALCLTMVPNLARQTAQGDRQAAAGFLGRVMLATSLLMAPAMGLLVVIGPTLGKLLFQQEAVGRYILPLAVGMLLACYQIVLSGALNGLGLQGKAAINAIVGDVVHLAFTWGLVSRVGLVGYVLGFVVSSLVGMCLNLACVLHATKLRAQLFEWFVRPWLAALFMGLWCMFFFRVICTAGFSPILACVVCLVLGLILYVAGLMAQGVSVTAIFPRRSKK